LNRLPAAKPWKKHMKRRCGPPLQVLLSLLPTQPKLKEI
jgi:hypothetical protein